MGNAKALEKARARREMILREMKKGVPVAKIAARLGVSRIRVYQIARTPVRRRGRPSVAGGRDVDGQAAVLLRRCREAREKAGLSVREVAEKIGVSSWTVGTWETGGAKMPIVTAEKALRLCGTSLSELWPRRKGRPAVSAVCKSLGWDVSEAEKALEATQ